MTSTQSLLASARSAYRLALRASTATFSGDTVVRNAFRLKIREEVLPYDANVDLAQFEEKVTLVRDIADVLRKNVVQARKVGNAVSSEEKERWELRITPYNELGSNDTIKEAKTESSRSARRREGHVNPDPASASGSSIVPRYYSQLKKVHKDRVVPELKEEDIEESFVRGSGPGGQSVNKTENNVQLLHKPTSIRVCCQETRSLKQNRKIARKILLDKLDALYNPGLSKQEMLKAKQIERERRRRKKAKKLHEKRTNVGESEGHLSTAERSEEH